MTLAELRKVTRPEARRAQCRLKIVKRSRVVDKLARDRLASLLADIIAPRVSSGRSVEVRWGYLTKRGMTDWVTVVRDPIEALPPLTSAERRMIKRWREEESGLKDIRGVLHRMVKGSWGRTHCGLNWYGLTGVAIDAELPRCPICWRE